MWINESLAIAAQLSKSINDWVEREKNVVVFDLKEQDDKQKYEELVSVLCSFIIGKQTFKCTYVGSNMSQHW